MVRCGVRRRVRCVGEGVEGALVCAAAARSRWGGGVVGLVGQAGGQESVVDAGEEHRGVEAVVGDR